MALKINALIKTTVPSRLILTLGTFLAGIIALGNNNIPLILATAASIAFADMASSSINSLYDREIDSINRKNRPSSEKMRGSTLAFAAALSLISLTIAFFINLNLIAIVIARLFFEYLYSVLRIKKVFIINHISVGVTYCIIPLLAASSITGNEIIPIFAYFFALSVIMTPLKDIDDVPGDKKYGVRTLPVVVGVQKAKAIIFSSAIILTLVTLILGGVKALIIPSTITIIVFMSLFAISKVVKDTKKSESILTKTSMLFAIVIEIMFALNIGGFMFV